MIEDKRRECINLGSYNYLGFAENDGPCTRQAEEATQDFGLSACSSRHELGTLEIHRKVRKALCHSSKRKYYKIIMSIVIIMCIDSLKIVLSKFSSSFILNNFILAWRNCCRIHRSRRSHRFRDGFRDQQLEPTSVDQQRLSRPVWRVQSRISHPRTSSFRRNRFGLQAQVCHDSYISP